MLEWIRCYLAQRMLKRREWVRNYNDDIFPKIQKRLEKWKVGSFDCIAEWHGELKFEVRCMNGEQYTVDLKEQSCSCRKWDLTGIPCPYAIACIQNRGQQPKDYVLGQYKKGAFMQAYEPIINPINGHKMWPKSGLTPPLIRRQPDRPKKLRRKEPDELINKKQPHKLKKCGNVSVNCRRCGKNGHNWRTCTVTLPEENQAEGSQAAGNQATMSQAVGSQVTVTQDALSQVTVTQATVNQGGGSQTAVSQGGGSQTIVEGSSCFEQLQGSTTGSPSTSNVFVIRTRRDKIPFKRSKSTSTHT